MNALRYRASLNLPTTGDRLQGVPDDRSGALGDDSASMSRASMSKSWYLDRGLWSSQSRQN